MPPNTVKVDRSTNFGNPYAAATLGSAEVEPALLVALFRDFMRSEASLVMRGLLPKIRGKNLACWCPLTDKDGNYVPCHADVLLELANAPAMTEAEKEG